MGFTEAQQKEINAQIQNTHKTIYGEMLSDLQTTLQGITIPKAETVKEEYRELYTKLNDFRNNLNRIVESGVSDDPMVNYRNEKKLAQCYDMGPGPREDLGEDADGVPLDPKLSAIINLFERIMAHNNGDAMEDEAFQNASIIIHQLQSTKHAYSLKRFIFEANKKKIKVEMAKQNIALYEEAIEKRVQNIRAYIHGDFDFSNLDAELQRAKAKHLEAKKRLEQEEWELIELPETNDEIRLLKKENEGYLEIINETEKEIADLGLTQMSVEEVLADCKVKADTFRLVKAELDRLEKITETDAKTLKDTQEDISRQEEIIKTCQRVEDGIVDGKGNSPEVKTIIYSALAIDEELQNYRKIYDLVSDEKAAALAGKWLESFSGNDEKAMQKHMDKQALILCDSNNPNKEENLKARRIVESLVFECGMKPAEVKAALCRPNVKEFAEEIEDKIRISNGKISELSNAAYYDKNQVDLLQTMDSIKAMRVQRNAAASTLGKLANIAGGLKEKLTKQSNRHRELQNKLVNSGFKEWIRKSYDQLNAVAQNEALQSKVPQEFFEKFKKPEDMVQAMSSTELMKEFDKHFADIVNVGNEIKTFIGAQKNDLDATRKEYSEKFIANEKKIGKITDEISADKLKLVNKLRQEEQQKGIIETRVEAMKSEQAGLLKHHQILQNDATLHQGAANSMVSDLDANITKTIFSQMLSKYNHLNDARVWWGDSKEYKDMIRPLCTILGFELPDRKTNVKDAKIDPTKAMQSKIEVVQALKEMKKNAERYIELKGEGHGIKTKQRYQRLTMAKELMAMSDEITKTVSLFLTVAPSFVPTQNAFNDAAKGMTIIKNDANAEKAYGQYLNSQNGKKEPQKAADADGGVAKENASIFDSVVDMSEVRGMSK